jgi:hypothetical protein
MSLEEKQDPFPRRVRDCAAGTGTYDAASGAIAQRFPVCLAATAGAMNG